MKLDLICKKQDEFFTPKYAIEPLQKYIPEGKIIWCPFDTKDSNFVKIFSLTNDVLYSHIFDGFDFFNCKIPDCDYIISNPPYSLKTEVLQKLFEIGKPFAMLVGVVGIFESQKRFNMFKNNKFEIMYFNKRISYFEDYNDPKPKLNPPFSSVYICSNILPNKIVFEEVKK
jgi:hypothetical protein